MTIEEAKTVLYRLARNYYELSPEPNEMNLIARIVLKKYRSVKGVFQTQAILFFNKYKKDNPKQLFYIPKYSIDEGIFRNTYIPISTIPKRFCISYQKTKNIMAERNIKKYVIYFYSEYYGARKKLYYYRIIDVLKLGFKPRNCSLKL